MTEKARSYNIKLTDIASGEELLSTVADFTDEEKRAAIAQIARWAGVGAAVAERYAEVIATKPKNWPRKI